MKPTLKLGKLNIDEVLEKEKLMAIRGGVKSKFSSKSNTTTSSST